MEEIGDLKAMRKNLMIVSLTVIALAIYADHISEINLWIIKFNNSELFDTRNAIVTLGILGYVLWRYLQYFKSSKLVLWADWKTQAIKFLEYKWVGKPTKIETYEMRDGRSIDWSNKSYEWVSIETIRAWKSIIIEGLNSNWWKSSMFIHDALVDENTTWYISNLPSFDEPDIKFSIVFEVAKKDLHKEFVYVIKYKQAPRYLRIKRMLANLHEKYYPDYVLPIYLGYVWIVVVLFEIYLSIQ